MKTSNYKSHLLSYSAIVFLLISLSSCGSFFDCVEGSGETVEWDTIIPAATTLESSINAKIKYSVDKRASQSSISITGEQNLLDLIRVESRNGTLEITAESCLNSKKGIIIEINGPTLKKLKLDGNANFISSTVMEVDRFKMEINGSGSADLSLKSEEIESIIYGNGAIKFSGKSNYFESKIIGSGDVDARLLKAERVYAKINGSGNMSLWSVRQLEIKISGSGEIEYKGNPKDLEQKIRGSGSVKRLD